MWYLKRALFVFAMASVALSVSFRSTRSGGNCTGGGGAGSPDSNQSDSVHSSQFQKGAQTFPIQGTQNPRGTSRLGTRSELRGSSSWTILPSTAIPALNRDRITRPPGGGLRRPTPAFPTGTRSSSRFGRRPQSIAPTMTTDQATPSPAPTAGLRQRRARVPALRQAPLPQRVRIH